MGVTAPRCSVDLAGSRPFRPTPSSGAQALAFRHRGGVGSASPMSRTADPWGARTPYRRGEPWPERVDSNVEGEGVDRWVQSASVLHSNGDAHGHRGPGRADRRRARARAATGSTAAGSDPKDLYGWQANNSPDRLTPAAGPRGRTGSSSRDWDTAMGRIVERSQAAARRARAAGVGSASTPPASCSSRSTTRSRVIGKAGHRHAAHGRQHAPVHGDRGGGAEGQSSAPTASPAPTPTSTTATRSRCGATTSPRRRRCCGCGCSTAAAGPTRRAMLVRRSPRDTPVAREADVHLAAAQRHEPGAA